MNPQATNIRPPSTVPLKSAVLCVDCESVSGSRIDYCPVCGSSSVFPIAPMLGGSLLLPERVCAEPDGDLIRFDLEIRIVLKQMEANDVNAALEGLTDLIRGQLRRSRASLHIEVEPVADTCSEYKPKAA